MRRVEEKDKNEFGWILLSPPKSADKTLKTFRREFIQMDSFRLDLLIFFMASACRCWGWGWTELAFRSGAQEIILLKGKMTKLKKIFEFSYV